jgi:ribosome-binding factor A
LRHALSSILRRGELRDPALQDLSITVTEVRVSADLRVANVFVMPLGGVSATAALTGLERCAGFLQGRLARDLALRFAPRLIFTLDPSFDQATRILSLLALPKVQRDLRSADGAGDRCSNVG